MKKMTELKKLLYYRNYRKNVQTLGLLSLKKWRLRGDTGLQFSSV